MWRENIKENEIKIQAEIFFQMIDKFKWKSLQEVRFNTNSLIKEIPS